MFAAAEAVSKGLIFSKAGIVFVVGIGIVFIALVIIIALLYLQALIFSNTGKKKAPQAVKEAPPAPAPQPTVMVEVDDEEEIAAVIAAVVAMLSQSEGGLVVRQVRRVGLNTPAWSGSGRKEYMDTRY